jgi:hypothetical protein
MTRPTFEVADILRVQGDRFLDRYRSSFGFQQLKAFRAILRCRTAALGGHRDTCPSCGHQAISYNSCRNRHCPKCQTQARERWLAARERELLTTTYFHVVFTVPHEHLAHYRFRDVPRHIDAFLCLPHANTLSCHCPRILRQASATLSTITTPPLPLTRVLLVLDSAADCR